METPITDAAAVRIIVDMQGSEPEGEWVPAAIARGLEEQSNALRQMLGTHAERTAYEIAYTALSDLKQGLTEPSHEGGLTRAEALDVVRGAIARIHHLLGKG